MDLHGRVREFVEQTLGAMGVPLEVAIEDSPDSVRARLVRRAWRSCCCNGAAKRSTRSSTS